MATDDSAVQRTGWKPVLIALYIAASVSFIGSISGFFLRKYLVKDFFEICFVSSVSTWLLITIVRVWQLSRATVPTEVQASRRIYSFPRRFGLGTLLVITLVFGALSAYFRWLQWPGELVLGALCFVGLVGAMQFAFERAPRHISVLVGSFVFAAWPIIMRLLASRNFNRFDLFDIAFLSAICAIIGAVVGYFTGTLIGGIFLLMDSAAAFLKKTPEQQSDQA
jgi:hypothetical protein